MKAYASKAMNGELLEVALVVLSIVAFAIFDRYTVGLERL